ncbi:transposase [Streptomyces sp. NPDC058424]|uniref:IS110 family transposase n=1 Tax=Streptomyces sp. NPDC058424 TaxID=3346491 RepID=UPI00364EECF4
MFDTSSVGVFLGMDVGKSAHHGHGLTPAGKKVFDKTMPNSEPKLRAVFDKLIAKFGTVLVIVDQPASIGALPLTVARDAGCQVAYLPGLAMRRIADTSFPTAAHLASYAGLAPTTRQSGTSIHGEHAPRGGNRQLKRAMFLSAFACMNADPASRTYYDRQRACGKTHTQALLRLARQRISVLFAMLRDGTFYETRTPEAAAA